MSELIVGLDIGGTKIAGGLMTERGELIAREELPTERHKGFAHSSRQMHRVLEALLDRARLSGSKVRGIGVCAPGPLKISEGILINPPNLEGWENLALQEMLEATYHLPVRLDNDANAAGLAEALWGAGKGRDHVFYATISTGIGTGIILHRRILHGSHGMAGEGGHLTIDSRDTARRCKCGNRGCIEAYASGTSLAAWARSRIEETGGRPPPILEEEIGGDLDRLTMKEIARAAHRGDAFCLGIIEQAGRWLGVWLGGIVSLLDPDIIVLGGGVSRTGPPLFEAIRRELPLRTINPFAAEVPVVQALLDRDAGILGAATLFVADREWP